MKKIIFFALVFIVSTSSQAQNLASFERFWRTFQPLLVNKNYKALARHINFPLKSYGVLDGMKVLTYSATNFGRAIDKFLALDDVNHNDANGNMITQSKLTILRNYGVLPEKERSNFSTKYTRIDDLEFKFIKGKWLLIAFYDGRTE
jgi:hypothetical protein